MEINCVSVKKLIVSFIIIKKNLKQDNISQDQVFNISCLKENIIFMIYSSLGGMSAILFNRSDTQTG